MYIYIYIQRRPLRYLIGDAYGKEEPLRRSRVSHKVLRYNSYNLHVYLGSLPYACVLVCSLYTNRSVSLFCAIV